MVQSQLRETSKAVPMRRLQASELEILGSDQGSHPAIFRTPAQAQYYKLMLSELTKKGSDATFCRLLDHIMSISTSQPAAQEESKGSMNQQLHTKEQKL